MSEFNQWVEQVSKWQDQVSSIPTVVRQDIVKSRLKIDEPARGIKSLLYDPLAVQYAMGYKDRKYSLTYDVLKRIPHQLAVVGAILAVRTNQVAAFSVPFRNSKSVGFMIKHKDPSHETTPSELKFIQELERFIYQCGNAKPNPYNKNKRDGFEDFLKKITRDSLTYDQACIEVVPDRRGLPYEFIAADASTIRFAANKNILGLNDTYHPRTKYSNIIDLDSSIDQGPFRALQLYDKEFINDEAAFVQVVNGQIKRAYTREEMIFGVRNPRSDIFIQGYGYGELEQLVTIITAHLYAEEYNRRFFMQGCVSGDTPVYTQKGIIPIAELEGKVFKAWNGAEFVDSDVVFSGVKRAIKTSLQNNQVLTTSPDQKFLSFDEAGNCKMIPISNLSVGDYVAQSDSLVEFNPLDPVKVTKTVYHQCPMTDAGLLDQDFYEFIGWLVGDGYISNLPRNKKSKINKRNYTVSCVFGPKDKEVFNKFRKMLSSRGINFHCRKSGGQWGNNPIDSLTIRNKGIFTFLKEVVGVSENKSYLKTVPSRILRESVENRAAFLRGLFSADGFIKDSYKAHLSSSSKELIEGVQYLLWSLGIHSSLSHILKNNSGRDCYYLRVSNNKEFAKTVGFLQTYKKQKQNKQDSLGKVPRELQQSLYKKIYDKDLPNNRWLTRRDLKRLTKNNNLELEALDYRWIEIKDIVDTGIYIPTYDVRQTHEKHQWSSGSCILSNSAPKGMLNFKGDAMSPEQLEGFKRQWRATLEGVENAWKTPILQSEQGIEWIDLHPSNREMEYNAWMEYLIKLTCAIFLIDPAELNFDLHGGVQQTPLFESSQEWKLKASRDRGLKPLLRFIAKLINENIIQKIDDHFVFDFVGLDELSEQEKHTLRTEQQSTYLTLNEVRRSEDLPSLEYGDMPMNPIYLQAMQLKQQMDQSAQQMQGQAQAGQAPPAQAAPQEPQKDNTPQYADSFGKSINLRVPDGKYLEIDISELDSWKTIND